MDPFAFSSDGESGKTIRYDAPAGGGARFYDPFAAAVVLRAICQEFVGIFLEVPHGYSRLGRGDTVEIWIPHLSVSRDHCTLFLDETGLWVRDNQSSHGVFVNGVRVTESQLMANSVIQLGDVDMAVEIWSRPSVNRNPNVRRPGDRTPFQAVPPKIGMNTAETGNVTGDARTPIRWGTPEQKAPGP